MPSSTAQRLAREFDGILPLESVEEVLADSLTRLDASGKVRTHSDVFVERFARERLRAMAETRGLSIEERPAVIFVCVHNAGRSQMAAALLDDRSKGAVRVHSAGSAPAAEINPVVVKAMAEIGLDVSKEFPKPLTDDVVRASDVVVTMGCGDACPVFPGKRYLDWELPDPTGKGIEEVRAIRDLIDQRVQALLEELIKTSA